MTRPEPAPPPPVAARHQPSPAVSSPPAAQHEVYRLETEEFALIVERPAPAVAAEPAEEPVAVEPAAATPSIPQKPVREQIHIVRRGDTLWDIAARYLGNPFRYHELAKLSEIRNPHLIHPGDRIRIIRKNAPGEGTGAR